MTSGFALVLAHHAGALDQRLLIRLEDHLRNPGGTDNASKCAISSVMEVAAGQNSQHIFGSNNDEFKILSKGGILGQPERAVSVRTWSSEWVQHCPPAGSWK
jgi:hypothetical protein